MAMDDSSEQAHFERKILALMAAARADPNDALGRLLQIFQESLRWNADRELPQELRDICDSSDLVQETNRLAYVNFPTFEGHTEAELRAWLLRIQHNFIRELHRQYATLRRG